MNVRRMVVVISVAAATMLAGTTDAFAEGSWTSYLSGWATGATSHRWHDSNLDSASTTVRFTGCTVSSDPDGPTPSATISVRQDISLQPDRNLGSKSNACSTTLSWGDVTSGNYFFQLDKINGTSGSGTFHLNASGVSVHY